MIEQMKGRIKENNEWKYGFYLQDPPIKDWNILK
jgi:hypothetical protein